MSVSRGVELPHSISYPFRAAAQLGKQQSGEAVGKRRKSSEDEKEGEAQE